MDALIRMVIAGLLALAAPVAAQQRPVIVNGEPLAAKAVQELERAQRAAIAPGRYWYDGVSGAWGREGAPMSGQMAPGLKLGGRLRADASGGGSGVFANGRQLTTREVNALAQVCRTRLARGRYVVTASGVGSVEGGSVVFNLAGCEPPPARAARARRYCDPSGRCSSHGLWAWIAASR